MKLIGLGLLCLLCPLAWADEFQYVSESNDTEFQLIAQPSPIASTYSGTGFLVSTLKKSSFFEALEWCSSRGYVLMGLPEEDDQDELFKSLRALNLNTILTEPLWIAASSMEDGVTWYWYSNGARIPNLYNLDKKPAPKGKFCLGFKASDGKWSTHPCSDKRYFICKCT